MRRLFTWLRGSPLHVVAIAAVLLAGWKAVQRYTPARTSPFAMWDFRAGGQFQALDKSMRRRTRRGFACHEPFQSVRYCEMRAYGIDGLIRVLVDSRGRVARIQFVPDTASAAMREEGRRIAAMWNQLRDPIADAPNARDRTSSTTRWISADERWMALIRYGRLGTTPVAVQLTDQRAFASIASTTAPLGPIVLVMNNLAESAEVGSRDELATALKRVQAGRAIDAGFATAMPATPGVAVAVCEPVALDLGVQSGESRRDKFADEIAAVLEKAVARAYPGSRLALGDTTRLIDSAGRGERVYVGPVDSDDATGGGTVAIAVTFSSRMTNAMDRLRDKQPADFCRATAEVLIAQRSPNGALNDVFRIPVGDDATMSNIVALELVPAEVGGDTMLLRVQYRAAYGTDRWAGALDWEEVISLETRRPLTRALLAFSHLTEESTMEMPGAIVMTKRLPGRVELATLEKHDWGFSTRVVTVPVSAGGVLGGVLVLQRLFQQPSPNETPKR